MGRAMATLAVGDRHEVVVVRELSRTQLVMYAGASGDFNPLHSDEVYATETAGFPSVVAHGALTMGATASAVTGWVDDAVLTRFGVRFLRQVWPGDTLTALVTVTAVGADDGLRTAEVQIATRNGAGEVVVSGYAALRELVGAGEADRRGESRANPS